MWPAVKSGEVATVPCANGPSGTNATRKCLGDFSSGVFWDFVSDSGCIYNSKVTSKLKSLSEVAYPPFYVLFRLRSSLIALNMKYTMTY